MLSFLDTDHYNSASLENCHYNSGILKHAITIIGLLESYHFLYQPLWAHCQTRMRMQSAYRRQFVYSVESSSPSNPIAVFFSLAPPLAYCGRAGGMSRSPPRRLGARSLAQADPSAFIASAGAHFLILILILLQRSSGSSRRCPRRWPWTCSGCSRQRAPRCTTRASA